MDDRYCPRCGQRNTERLVSTRRLVAETLEDQLSLDATLPRTLLSLLFRPGFLTREYVSGRIARYIPPLRLYLVSSLLFFVVLSFVAEFDVFWRAVEPRVEEAMRAPAGERPASSDSTIVIVNSQLDTTRVPGWLRPVTRHYVRQEARINALPPREGLRVLYDATVGNVPLVLFLLVPLFALFLKALYRRRYYVEHFVFVLHLHTLAFLLATVLLLVQAMWAVVAFTLWLLAYLFAAMRRVYGRSVLGTAARYAVLLLGYYAALAGTVIAVMVFTVLTV